ncbi:MAG: hypothetical protein R6V10_05460 [bacterium]
MSRLYDVAVLGGEDAGSWLCAAAFAKMDLRVALVLERTPDSGAPPFFQSLADPGRSSLLLPGLGLSPCKGPPAPFEPDFQLIVNGKPVDFVADAFHAERAEDRDLQDSAPLFRSASKELCELADGLLDQARQKSFPVLRRRLLPEFLSRSTIKMERELADKSFGEWAKDLPDFLKHVFLGTASACAGRVLSESAPLLQVALFWCAGRGLSAEPREESLDLREYAANLISRRGAVMEGSPEALLYGGRTLHGVRFSNGAIIDTRLLVSPVRLFYRLYNEGAEKVSFPARLVRKSWFLKIERATLPESLCWRSLIVNESAARRSLMLLTRAARVPRRDTACLTFLEDDAPESAEEALSRLASSLPWLDSRMISVDDTREPVVMKYPAASLDLLSVYSPRLPLFNVLVHPGEVLPSWGPAGVMLSIVSMQARARHILQKLKKRRA